MTVSKNIAHMTSFLEGRMREASKGGLLLGMSCSFAFIIQVFFAPAMTHVTPLMLSFTDVSYVFGAMCAAALLVMGRRGASKPRLSVLWGLSCALAALFVLYGVLVSAMQENAQVGAAVNVLFVGGGALFGAFTAYMAPLWLRVCALYNPGEIAWTILLASSVGGVLVWFLADMAGLRLLVASEILLFTGTHILGRTLSDRLLDGGFQEASPKRACTGAVSARLFAAVFLVAFAFVVAITCAETRGASSIYKAGTFFAPVLIACVCLLVLRGLTVFSLLNMAVPIITAVVMAASFLGVDPVVSFDLAVAGVFLFFVYAVAVILFATYGSDEEAYRCFLALALSLAGGCVVGRIASVFAVLGGLSLSGAIVPLSILAIVVALLLCVKTGSSGRESSESGEGEVAGDTAFSLVLEGRIDAAAKRYGLGRRETEVLSLLLKGKTANEVSQIMVIALGTAKSHVCHVYRKLGVHSREELFAMFGIDG